MQDPFVGNDLFQLIKHVAKEQSDRDMLTCGGYITSVDPKRYEAKVLLMPWEIETNWIPLPTIAVGPEWGWFHLPPDNTECLVEFAHGHVDSGRIVCYYTPINDVDKPPAGLKPGEFLLKHASGSLLHFDEGGNVALTTQKDLTLDVQGDLNATVQGDASITASGSVGVTGGSVTIGNDTTIDGRRFLEHVHQGAQSGPGTTGPVV